MIDIIGVSKGHGFEGVVTRWGVTRLVRKSHRGLRKVPALVHGTLLVCSSRSHVLVRTVMVTEQRSTRRFTGSVPTQRRTPRVPQLSRISPRRASHLWEASPTTVK